jgi:hypothetical protein
MSTNIKSIKITDTIFGTNSDGEEIEIMPDGYTISFSQDKTGHYKFSDYYFILMEGYRVEWLNVEFSDIKPFLGSIK